MPKTRKQNMSTIKRKKSASQKKNKENFLEQPEKNKAISEPVTDNSLATQESEIKMENSAQESEIKMEDYADVSQEKVSIISIVKDLEGQVDTAFKLKEALEADLDETQKKLSEESAVRARLAEQVKSLEAQADLADQLRQDISFAEQERNKFANLLEEIQPQLETVTQERDLLAEKVASAEAHTKKLDEEKTAFEAQVMNLKDKITDIDRLHEELENLGEKLEIADGRIAELDIQLEEQQAVNRNLMECKGRLESDMKKKNLNLETAKNELDACKKALRDIRSEAALASGRVRQRYFKAEDKK